MTACNITADHCQLCGSTDHEDMVTGDQGYTACCNEPVTNAGYCRNGDDHNQKD